MLEAALKAAPWRLLSVTRRVILHAGGVDAEPPERDVFIFHAWHTCILFGLHRVRPSACMHDRYTTLSWIIENMSALLFTRAQSFSICMLLELPFFSSSCVAAACKGICNEKEIQSTEKARRLNLFFLSVWMCASPAPAHKDACEHAQTPFASILLKAVQQSRYFKWRRAVFHIDFQS